MKAVLVIVAKEPVPGKVKTRLYSHLGAQQTSELYRLFIQDMVEEMSKLYEHALAIAYTPEAAEPAFKTMIDQPIQLFPQQGADLGQRLSNVFQKMFDEGYEQVHIINSDSPDLPHRLVKQSILLLSKPRTELVLGPCADGGYYLVGLRRSMPALFNQIPWSTDQVLRITLEKARRLGLQWALLGPWYDIDTFDDLLRFLRRNGTMSHEQGGPGWRTLRYMRSARRQIYAHKNKKLA
jgi:rSAM/selenodomain-associated transferase 1